MAIYAMLVKFRHGVDTMDVIKALPFVPCQLRQVV